MPTHPAPHAQTTAAQATSRAVPHPLDAILELARWAPSGDNEQPWRFEVDDAYHLVVHVPQGHHGSIYDLHGHGTLLSLGALLETLAIAASAHGLRLEWRPRGEPGAALTGLDVSLEPAATTPDALAAYVRTRAVHRGWMRTRRLSADQKAALEQGTGGGFELRWIEGLRGRWRMARLALTTGRLRLDLPEAYETHRRALEWGVRYSRARMPVASLSLDPLTRRAMRWAMGSPQRIARLNHYLGASTTTALQMDWAPALACGAHFLLLAPQPPQPPLDYLQAGRAIQRVWLTATRLGLQMQPQYAPVAFTDYVYKGTEFTRDAKLLARARWIASTLSQLAGPAGAERTVFMGRVGHARPPRARSLRLPLEALLVDSDGGPTD